MGVSLVAQTVKRLSAMQETRVRSLGWEDPLEKEMATHSSILAWRILMNYGRRFVTLYRSQGARPSPRKRNENKKNGCIRSLYK